MEFHLVQLLLVLIVAWGAGTLAQRVGYPAILGELAAGILFGPAVLGLLHPSGGLAVLAELGVFLMMLYIGMAVDYRDLAKASWAGLLAALGGFCIPMYLGYMTSRWFGYDVTPSLFLGLAMGVTSLATKSRILVDLNILGTRIAGVLFAGALICDTAALVVFAAIMGLSSEQGIDFGNLAMVLGKAVLFFGVTIALGLRVFPVIGPLLRKLGFTERTANFTLVVMIGLVFAELAELAGLHAILGAFLAGMFLRDEVMKRKISHEVTTLVGDMSLGFLAPIFFVTAGFHVSFGVFLTDLPMLLIIIFLAFAGKILGTALGYLPTGHGWREGLTIGFGMNGRGAVEIIIAGIALELGLIGENLFSILVFMAFATTASVPVLMKLGVSWLRGRGELVRTDDKRSGILIVGAAPLARLLAREFQADHSVTLIDNSERRCAIAEREGFQVFPGSALEVEVLHLAGADQARMLVSMTTNQAVNAVAAQRAREFFGIPEVYSLRDQYKLGEIDEVGSAVSGGETKALFPVAIDVGMWNRWAFQEEVERGVVHVTEAASAAEVWPRLGDAETTLPILVVRNGRKHLPGAFEDLEEGDQVVVLRRRASGQREDPFAELVCEAPVLDLPASATMEETFAKVSRILSARLRIPAERIQEMLTQREEDSSTVIFPGVAIPHILIDGVHRSALVLIRSRDGVSFFGEDSAVRILFIIAGTKDERNRHLRILSSIAQLLQDSSFEERWMDAEGEAELRAVVLDTERRKF